MINLVTGVPGSGKTLLALKMLTDKYFVYSKQVETYFKRPEFNNITIITNIDSLKLDHLNLDQIMKQAGKSFDDFFNYEFQKKIAQKYPQIIYVLDECQRYLSRRLPAETTLYFDMHRHLDHNIYLITQDFKKIHYDITSLIEFEYRLVKRSLSITGEFRYHIKINNEITATKGFRPSKSLFAIYKSFTSNDNQIKSKNLYFKYIAVPVIICLVGFISFFRLLGPDGSGKQFAVAASVPDHDKQTDLNSLRAGSLDVEKTEFIIENLIKRDGSIYYFQCPLSHRYFFRADYPLPLLAWSGRYIVSVSSSDRQKFLALYPPVTSPTGSSSKSETETPQSSDRFRYLDTES